ncbi:MAG: pilus (MSHA type) biogenesis protein MshL [Magnetococcales bacterium]|nr:pilus (MSHA type) biogenesis protein MshL [Magnetococcales bacterium]
MKDAQYASDWNSEIVKDVNNLASSAPNRGLKGKVVSGSDKMADDMQHLRDLEAKAPLPPPPPPVMPTYNPMDDIKISLEMDKADVRHLLRALAQQTNMDLLLHPEVVENPPIVTVSFRDVSATTVFNEIMRLADLNGRIEGRVLRVDAKQETVLHLEFLDAEVQTTFTAGGDVLGAASAGGGGGGGGGGITGNFHVSGKSGKTTNPYDQMDEILKNLVTDEGVYSINRQSGTLYLKAKPSIIKTVTELVQRYKEVLNRQVLIEARIIEIRLSDEYKMGVDWAMLRTDLAAANGLQQTLTQSQRTYPLTTAGVQAGTSHTLGNAISQLSTATVASPAAKAALSVTVAGKYGLAALSMLKQFGELHVLSNPSIRAKQGAPSLISVGRTNTYISKMKSTVTGGGGGVAATVSTDAETSRVFDGLMIGVVPFVKDDGRIAISINPIKSDVVDASLERVQISSDIRISLPQVDLREMSTVLELNNGDTVLLGGLIDRDRNKVRTGVPILSELPLLGALFTSNADLESVRELVLMLRVNVL